MSWKLPLCHPIEVPPFHSLFHVIFPGKVRHAWRTEALSVPGELGAPGLILMDLLEKKNTGIYRDPKIRSTVFNHAVDSSWSLHIQKSHISKSLTLSSHDAWRFCSCNLPSRKIPCLMSGAQKCRLWIIWTLNHPNPNLDHFKQKINKHQINCSHCCCSPYLSFLLGKKGVLWPGPLRIGDRGSKATPCNSWHLGRPAVYQVVLWKWLILDKSW